MIERQPACGHSDPPPSPAVHLRSCPKLHVVRSISISWSGSDPTPRQVASRTSSYSVASSIRGPLRLSFVPSMLVRVRTRREVRLVPLKVELMLGIVRARGFCVHRHSLPAFGSKPYDQLFT